MSDAADRYARLAVSSRAQVDEVTKKIIDYPILMDRFRSVADFVAVAPDGFNIQNAMLHSAGVKPIADTIRSMGDRITDPSRIDRLVFGTLELDEAMAETSRLEDGSGLVLISSGLLGLCLHLAQINSFCLEHVLATHGARRRLRAFGLYRRGHDDSRVLLSGAILRYHLLHRRLHGNSGTVGPLLSEHMTDLANTVLIGALQFICAHEAAHFMLGHPSDPLGFVTSKRLPVIADSHALEFDADQFAVDVVHETQRRTGFPTSQQLAAGARIAMSAIALMESGHFVRRARTHPPAGGRWERLRSGILNTTAGEQALLGMLNAVEVGGDPYRPLPDGAWDNMAKSDEVARETHDDDYMRAHRDMDVMLTTWPTSKFLDGLPNVPPTGDVLAAGLRLGLANNLEAAAEIWGVRPTDVEQLTGRSSSLGFYTALEILMDSEAARGIEGLTTRRICAGGVATVLAREGKW